MELNRKTANIELRDKIGEAERAEALEFIDRHEPDVLLLDLKMRTGNIRRKSLGVGREIAPLEPLVSYTSQ